MSADRVGELLARLIGFPTQQSGPERGAGDERALCDFLAPLVRACSPDELVIGDPPRTDGGPGAYLFARWGSPRRLVNVHLDTVPANAGWSRDPWHAHLAGGRLYGLGSADTKGAIAAIVVALQTSGAPHDFGILFSGDEERGSGVIRAFLAQPVAREIRQVIVCEPTARVAGVAHRGVLAQHATLVGPGGHSSKADQLPKPLARLARLATALDDSALRRLGEGPPGMTGTCLNLAALHGGVAFNVIAGRAQLEWSLRPYPGFDRASWDAELAQLVTAIDPAITVATTIDHPPFACDALAELVRPFVARVGSLDFWTEAALWAAHGADAIVIGPGDIAQAHAADEWVELADLDWAVAMFQRLLAA